jgi:hypothetical protein
VRGEAFLSAADRPPILRAMRRLPIDPVFPDEPEPPERCCDHPGCAAGGDFRAPKSRLDLKDYYWFCLDHVRAYNSAWNYYAGMSDREIEAEIRRDTVWQRPSWRLGERHGPFASAHLRDPFDLYPGKAERPRARRRADAATARALSAHEQALAVFELQPPLNATRVRARYRVLVKMHHPDAHGGDKAAEEKLKVINQAYATLKASYFG